MNLTQKFPVISFVTSENFLYVVKRLLQGVLSLFLASVLCFTIIQLAPGNYLDTLIDQNSQISPETLESFKIQFGLDQSPVTQYRLWLWRVVTRFDFGQSFVYFRPVSELIVERMRATLLLAIASIFFTWAIAIPLGIISAVKQNTLIDQLLRTISYIGQGFPSFITALFLLFIAQLTSPWLPVGGMTSINHDQLTPVGKIVDLLWHMFLPTVALSLTSFAGLQRLTRGQLLDVLHQDYIKTARAKGLPENRVLYIHALRNAINPLITLLGFEFASLLSGSFIAEYFFSWPGMGRLVLQAVQAKDLYLVMASLMMGATMLIIGNLLADLLLKFTDPRIRLENLK
ncbi:ABC transporter permease [Gloeocapsa sp. PCC 73106]|uniref:ABC transporter permease n=1 Tax=Gloeocapsa sp. PCC 73106 TaxID=102232 RepID=UPI0002AC370F|nr:ABC transporter permease [Gloeocapsa sp. PCC 73106]ELR97848.1 ABC-type dipeptide/oligopeptide/nickel transport system, permease component [Gloeocapsa sp. PCC 73106]